MVCVDVYSVCPVKKAIRMFWVCAIVWHGLCIDNVDDVQMRVTVSTERYPLHPIL